MKLLAKRLLRVYAFTFLCIIQVYADTTNQNAFSTQKFTITFDREEFSIEDLPYGNVIKSNKYDLKLEEDTLKPAIPYVYIRIVLPIGETIKNFSFNIESLHCDSSVLLISNPAVRMMSDIPIEQHYSNVKYPIKNYPFSIELVGEDMINGNNVVCFKVTPISYNAIEEYVMWASIINLSIETTFTTKRSYVWDEKRPHKGDLNDFLQRILCNPKDLIVNNQDISRNLSSNYDYVDYVIITSESLKNSFKPLADWKKTKGVITEIITVEDIYNNYEGATNQLKIKNFLYDYYLNRGLEYALLGGDDCIVPVQGCYGMVNSTIDNTIPADLFYACYDGVFNWDADGDGIIGESTDDVNYTPQIYCSRIPLQDTIDVRNFVNRIISYEKVDNLSHDYSNMLLAGVKTFAYDFYGHSDAEIKGNYMYDNYIRNYWSNGVATRFYDTFTDFPEAEAYDVNDVNMQNQLTNKYYFVNMDSHGDFHCWSMENGGPYFKSKVQLLQNDNPMIITTSACKTNGFDALTNKYRREPCLSEAFIRNNNCNVIAYLGGSRSGWGITDAIAEYLGASIELNAYFYNELFSGTETNFAKIVAEAKIRLGYSERTEKWVQYSVNPIGDAEMPIYTATPQSFNDIVCTWDGTNIMVDTKVSDCTITISGISNDGEDYFCTFKKKQNVLFPGFENGIYTLCVTKHNYKPFITKILIGEEYIQNETINDDRMYVGNTLRIGSNVIDMKPMGNVVVEPNGKMLINKIGKVILEQGFYCKIGGVLLIK